MIYENIRQAVFIDRPNRFIANILLDGRREICHVKNTGRCHELLIPGAAILVQYQDKPGRKTNYDLIAVYKGDRLVNIDSQAPNQVFAEWLREGRLFRDITLLRPESPFGSARFDFYIEADNHRAYIEVKGVTLEEEGIASFPDAPTQRGINHLKELIACVSEGFDAYAVFIVQMKGVKYMEPNRRIHPAFADALFGAKDAGVKLLVLDCFVTRNSIAAADFVDIVL